MRLWLGRELGFSHPHPRFLQCLLPLEIFLALERSQILMSRDRQTILCCLSSQLKQTTSEIHAVSSQHRNKKDIPRGTVETLLLNLLKSRPDGSFGVSPRDQTSAGRSARRVFLTQSESCQGSAQRYFLPEQS